MNRSLAGSLIGLLPALSLVVCTATHADSQFSNVLSIPPAPNIGDNQSIDSNTQLNLGPGGAIGVAFNAGSVDGSITNIEVNVAGGTVGSGFEAHPNSAVNFSGGVIGENLGARLGSTVNLSGGTFGDGILLRTGADANLFGGEFRLNGAPIAGLEAVGSSQTMIFPEAWILSGTLADGTPFAFSNRDSDRIDNGYLTLHTVALPLVGPGMITTPGVQVPLGIRSGQTLIVNTGGAVGPHFNAGPGSRVEIHGGQVGKNLEAVGAHVIITHGTIGTEFDAFNDSVIEIQGGTVGNLLQVIDSSAAISGGQVEFMHARSGSRLFISGGKLNNLRAEDGSSVTLTGGKVGVETAIIGLEAKAGSHVTIQAREFILDGVDITASISQFVPQTITERDVILEGIYQDGTPFEFQLHNGQRVFFEDYFSADATLQFVRVPEPSCWWVLLGALLRRQRR